MRNEPRLLFERIERLPEEARHRIAAMVREELEEEEADEVEPTAAERAAIQGADAEFAAGEYVDFDDYVRKRGLRAIPSSGLGIPDLAMCLKNE